MTMARRPGSADDGSPGRRERRRGQQGLYLHEHPVIPSRPAKTPAPVASRSWSARNGAESWDFQQTPIGHFKDADLVGRAMAVLDRAQDAELVAALTFGKARGRPCVPRPEARRWPLPWSRDRPGSNKSAPLGEANEFAPGGAPDTDRAQRHSRCPTAWSEWNRRSTVQLPDPDQGGDDIANAGRGRELRRRFRQAKTFRPKPKLVDGFLAGDKNFLRPLRAAATAIRMVDFPMPGSPPRRITEAGANRRPLPGRTRRCPFARGPGRRRPCLARRGTRSFRPCRRKALWERFRGLFLGGVIQAPQSSVALPFG